MPNSRIASPGRGGSPRTVARKRTGVCSGVSPRIQTGAITIRAPLWPGLSTSTTQASITVGSLITGAIGAATISVRTLAAAKPPATQAIINSGQVRRRAHPRRLAAIQAAKATTAPSNRGHNGGSIRRAK